MFLKRNFEVGFFLFYWMTTSRRPVRHPFIEGVFHYHNLTTLHLTQTRFAESSPRASPSSDTTAFFEDVGDSSLPRAYTFPEVLAEDARDGREDEGRHGAYKARKGPGSNCRHYHHREESFRHGTLGSARSCPHDLILLAR